MDTQAIWRQSYAYSSQCDVSLRHGYDTLPLHDETHHSSLTAHNQRDLKLHRQPEQGCEVKNLIWGEKATKNLKYERHVHLHWR